MDFEDKIYLALEMTEYRIELASENADNATIKELTEQQLPTSTHPNDVYSECVRAMFNLINELEAQHNAQHHD